MRSHKTNLLRMIQLEREQTTWGNEQLHITIAWYECLLLPVISAPQGSQARLLTINKLTYGRRVDLCGAFAQDISPRLPLPATWQPAFDAVPDDGALPNPLPSSIASVWKQELPKTHSWIAIFSTLSRLLATRNTPPNSWMGPILHRLLRIRPLQSNTTRAGIIEEVSRIGTLLFLAPIWRTFSTRPVQTATLRLGLLSIMKTQFVQWGELRPLLLWILMHAAGESEQGLEQDEFLVRMAMVMKMMGIQSWEEMLRVVQDVLWSEAAGRVGYDAMRTRLQVFCAAELLYS